VINISYYYFSVKTINLLLDLFETLHYKELNESDGRQGRQMKELAFVKEVIGSKWNG